MPQDCRCTVHYYAIVNTPLEKILLLADDQAAEYLHARMQAWGEIDQLHDKSYSERGRIALEFERRLLWKHLVDPITGVQFSSWTAWMSSGVMGCRRTNFSAKKDIEALSDVPFEHLVDIPKCNLKILRQLSTAIRNDASVLADARSLSSIDLASKIASRHPGQHIEPTVNIHFNPDSSGAIKIEEALSWALQHDIAGTRDEAIVRMAEIALTYWHEEQEIIDIAEKIREEA